MDALAPLEPHAVPVEQLPRWQGPSQASGPLPPRRSLSLPSWGRNLGDGGYLEAEVADAKVMGLRHTVLLRVSAAGRVDAAGRTLKALTCSVDSVPAVQMLKRLKPSFHVCSAGPGRCKVKDKALLHVRRFRILTPVVFAARLAAATAEPLHLCKPIDAGIAGAKTSKASDDEDTAEDYDDAVSPGAESVDIGGRVSPTSVALGVAKGKAAKEKEAAVADAKAKAVTRGKGVGAAVPDASPDGAADQLEAALLGLTKSRTDDAKVITVDGAPAVASKASLGGVALSASDLDLMKARLDELRKKPQ